MKAKPRNDGPHDPPPILYNLTHATRELRKLAEYGDQRIKGFIVRKIRVADPYDSTPQKSSLHVLNPVRNGLLCVSYLSASNPFRSRQSSVTYSKGTVPGMHKQSWVNVTRSVVGVEDLISQLQCLRCGKTARGHHPGPTCHANNPCVFAAFSWKAYRKMNAVLNDPVYRREEGGEA